MTQEAAKNARRGLDRAEILATALRIVDEHGPAKLSMRGLARALGVAPMTIYWHVGDRAGLLDAVVAEVLGGVRLRAPDAGSWSDRMASVLTQLRNELLRHPNVLPLLTSPGRLAPALITTGEDVLVLIAELGLNEERTVQVFRAVIWHTLGSLFVESFLHERDFFEDSARTRAAFERAVDAAGLGENAAARRLASEATELDSERLFRYGTAMLLEGIERDATRSRRRARRPPR